MMLILKKYNIVLVCCLLAGTLKLAGQQSRVDSLLAVVQTAQEDSNKVNTLNLLAWEMVMVNGEYDKTIEYANHAIEVAKKVDYKKGQAKAFNIIGAAFMFQGNYPEALNNYEASLKIREEMGDKKGIAAAYSNIGLVYMYQGDYSKSLKNHKASLKIEKELGDKTGISGSYNNIGIVYEDLGNYPEALNNYLSSLKIDEELGNKSGIANTLSNIGVIKEIQRNYKEALMYHFYSLKIKKELGDQRGISDCYTNIGNIYIAQRNYVEALKSFLISLKIYEETGNQSGIALSYKSIGLIYDARGDSALAKGDKNYALKDAYPIALKNYLAALIIREEIGDKSGAAASCINIGSVYVKLRDLNQAEKYLEDGLDLSLEIGHKKTIKDSYKSLSILDSVQGNLGKAYEDYKMFIVYRDSLSNEENTQKSVLVQMQYEIEKDQLREAQEEEKRLREIARRDVLQYTLIVLVIFLVVGAVMLLGAIKVPPALARGLNFVSLLLVFESILVFADPQLDRFTHGAPIYKLMINILLAIMIFPIHSYLERRFKKRLKLE